MRWDNVVFVSGYVGYIDKVLGKEGGSVALSKENPTCVNECKGRRVCGKGRKGRSIKRKSENVLLLYA